MENFEKYKIEWGKDNQKKKRKCKEQSIESSSGSSTAFKQAKLVFRTSSTLDQAKFDQLILNYVVNGMRPLSTVEDPDFRNLFIKMDFGVSIMSRRTLGRKLDDMYLDINSKVKETIKFQNYVCTTADIWSSKSRSFMGVTAHWIDEHLERQSAALACRRLKGSHTYDKIAETLFDINSEFGLSCNQIISTVTDNGSNFIKAFKDFGIRNFDIDEETVNEISTFAEKMDADFGDEPIEFLKINPSDFTDEVESSAIKVTLPNHIRCASHTLSLTATTDVNKFIKTSSISRLHETAISKCSILWRLSSRQKTAEIIEEVLHTKLSYPVPTRWNSLFDALCQILKQKEKLDDLFHHLDVKNSFKAIEIEYIEEYVLVLKPIAIAIDRLQGEKNCFFGQLLPTIFTIQTKLKDMKNFQLKHCDGLRLAIIDSLEKRWKSYINLDAEADRAIIAACSHPMFKMRWLPSSLLNEKAKEIQNTLVNLALPLINQREESEENKTGTDDDWFIYNDCTPSSSSSQNAVELEVLQFLADKSVDLKMLNSYPTVKELFRKFNTSLPSSAPVERLFSFASIINSPKRNLLSDSQFEKLVLLKANRNFQTKF